MKNDLLEFVEIAKADLPPQEIFRELGAPNANPVDLIGQLELTYGLGMDVGSHTERRIKAFKRKQPTKDVATTKLDANVLSNLLTESLIPLIKDLETKCVLLKEGQFNEDERQMTLQIAGHHINVANKNTSWPEIESTLLGNLGRADMNLFMSALDYNYQLRGNRKSLEKPYATAWLQFQFQEYAYSIRIHQDWQSARTFSYDEPLSKSEMDVIVGMLIDKLLDQVSEKL